jgi:hypothetical protein
MSEPTPHHLAARSASRLLRLLNMEAPRTIIENEFDLLKRRIEPIITTNEQEQDR